MDATLLSTNLTADNIHMPVGNVNVNVNVGMPQIPMHNEAEMNARSKAANRMRKFRMEKRGDKEWLLKEAER
jgi:hypothetical protein